MSSTNVALEPSSMLPAYDSTRGARAGGGNRGSPEKTQRVGASPAAGKVR